MIVIQRRLIIRAALPFFVPLAQMLNGFERRFVWNNGAESECLQQLRGELPQVAVPLAEFADIDLLRRRGKFLTFSFQAGDSLARIELENFSAHLPIGMA